MSDPTDNDMDQPITKREALDLFITRREFHDVMKNLFDYLDRKFASADKRTSDVEASTHLVVRDVEASTHLLVREMGVRFTNETQAVVREVSQQHRGDLSKLDEKYKDLPDRVTKLESAVFGPTPLKRQRRR